MHSVGTDKTGTAGIGLNKVELVVTVGISLKIV